MGVEEWVRTYLHMSADAAGLLLSVVTVVVTLSAFLLKRRKQLIRLGRIIPMAMRASERRYLTWFVGEHGQYWNPYLNARREWHSLERTFIPLHFGVERERTDAAFIIGDPTKRRMAVTGQPGSGKSTMLRQYGVERARLGLTRRRFRRGDPRPDVPFLVSLRVLARELPKVDGLAGYLVRRVLVQRAGLSIEDAQVYLRELLAGSDRGGARCAVLLDGLDEVPESDYRAVREAIKAFAENNDPHLPTANARIVLSCRTHNFRRNRKAWLGERSLLNQEYELASLRTAEVVSYLNKLKDEGYFERKKDGPEYFLREVRAANALDMHSIPLVLAMSVGLFAPKVSYRIPTSVAQLYDLMITAMLERHNSEDDPQGSIELRFPDVEDKRRLLREFAFLAATSEGGMSDVDREALVAFARQKVADGKLRNVVENEATAFVDEIISRSGLLSDASGGDRTRLVFAHRSIQEHLVAEELRLRRDEGADLLLERAKDPEWAQITLFYAAAEEQRYVNPFLERLAAADAELAGLCLAAADCLDAVAMPILDTLHERLLSGRGLLTTLSALLSATKSPRQSIQVQAVNMTNIALAELIERQDVATALSQDTEGTVNLLNGLADAGAATGLVSRIAEMLPDHPKLVEPLWRTLNTSAGHSQITARLLAMAIDPECFAELQRQEAYRPRFATAEMRRAVYPFHRDAHDPMSNFVTLLCWAERLNAVPSIRNRFLEAKAIAPKLFERVERDRRWTLRPSLFWPARILSLLSMASFVTAAWVLVDDWRVVTRPWGWWSVLLYVAVAAAIPAFGIIAAEREWWPWLDEQLEEEEGKRGGTVFYKILDAVEGSAMPEPLEISLLWTLGFGPSAALAITFAPLAATSVPLYLAVTVGVSIVVMWIPMLAFTGGHNHVWLLRRNRLVGMYDHPDSRHWVLANDRRQGSG